MTIRIVAAIVTGVAAYLVVAALAPRPRPVAVRVRPYTQLSRARLGASYDSDALRGDLARGGSVRAVLGPILSRALNSIVRVFDADPEAVERRIRQAHWAEGSGTITDRLELYRRRQVAWMAGGAAAGVAITSVSGRGPIATLAAGVALAFSGVMLARGRVDRAVEDRASIMRSEVYTITQLLSVYLRASGSVPEAIRRVAARGTGPVAKDLSDARGLSADGVELDDRVRLRLDDALEHIADTAADPSAARLYRVLAAGHRKGSDVVPSLLALAEDVRRSRREEVERSATKRQTAQIVPMLVFMAPILIMEIVVVIPSLVFGQ